MSTLYRKYDAKYADTCLENAKIAFEFGKRNMMRKISSAILSIKMVNHYTTMKMVMEYRRPYGSSRN